MVKLGYKVSDEASLADIENRVRAFGHRSNE